MTSARSLEPFERGLGEDTYYYDEHSSEGAYLEAHANHWDIWHD